MAVSLVMVGLAGPMAVAPPERSPSVAGRAVETGRAAQGAGGTTRFGQVPGLRALEGKVLRAYPSRPAEGGPPRLMVLLETPDGAGVLADLGPRAALDELRLCVGAKVRLEGEQRGAGERRWFLARKVTARGRTIVVDRGAWPAPG
jgi:hypothetical protein